MSVGCGCGGCVSRGVICVPKGDNMDLIFNVTDSQGALFDISGAIEIIFIVSEGSLIGGNIGPGGDILIEKRLTDGTVIIAGTNYQYIVKIIPSDTLDIEKTNLYYETRITASDGTIKTLGNGIFVAENTMIRGA